MGTAGSDEQGLDASWHDMFRRVVEGALREDMCRGDVTTQSLIPSDRQCRARVICKADGILAGVDVAAAVFEAVDSGVATKALAADGSRIRERDAVAVVEGRAASVLMAERTALNFLQHLSGVATEAGKYVDQTRGTKAQVLDTRKTLPGLRQLEKYAVRMGGARNHRMNLGAGVLIKDNHLAVLRSMGIGLGEAVRMARRQAPAGVRVEVEVDSVEAASEALEAGADVIMLDNMGVDDVRRVVEAVNGRALIEASGGITIGNVAAVAECGVDFISVGALTHSARALDMSLEIDL
jgi:nicotinate-nucleotide pyrophosphorylase (carboxylating)